MCERVAYYWVTRIISEVQDDYDGPHIIDGKITETFVKELLVAFKEQKKLHQKYAYQYGH